MPEYPIATVIREFACPTQVEAGQSFQVSGRLCIPGVSYPHEGYPNQEIRLIIDGVQVATTRTWDAYKHPHENIGIFSFTTSIPTRGLHTVKVFYPGKPPVEDRTPTGIVFYLESERSQSVQVGQPEPPPPPPPVEGAKALIPIMAPILVGTVLLVRR